MSEASSAQAESTLCRAGAPDERRLLALAKAGHHDSVEAIFARYSGLVRALSRRYFLPRADFDDIVQEGMLGLFKAIGDYDLGGKVSFANFAGLCIRRQLITAVKTSTRLKHHSLNSAVSLEQPLKGDKPNRVVADQICDRLISSPEESLIRQEGLRGTLVLLQRELSALEMRVLVCSAQGMKQAEIARKLQIRLKAVDNALGRVKRKCRQENLG